MKLFYYLTVFCCSFVLVSVNAEIRMHKNSGLMPPQQAALLKAHATYMKRLKSMGVSTWFISPEVMTDFEGNRTVANSLHGRIDKEETSQFIKYLEKPDFLTTLDAGFSLQCVPLLINCPTTTEDLVEMEVFDNRVAFRIRIETPVAANGDFFLTEEGSTWLLKRLAKK